MPYRNDGDWARQIPSARPEGPYQDYGWESHESALPEFRDPDVQRMPYDDRPWRATGYLTRQEGPHVGKGPKGYRRSDERIYDDVCSNLWQHGQIDASDIDVSVENGEVTLKGTVDSRSTKRMAEDTADSIPGVQDVHNQLKIRRMESR